MSILHDLALMKENARTASYLETLHMRAFMLTFSKNKMNHEYLKFFSPWFCLNPSLIVSRVYTWEIGYAM